MSTEKINGPSKLKETKQITFCVVIYFSTYFNTDNLDNKALKY